MSALLLAGAGPETARQVGFPILSTVVLVPVIGSIVVALISKRRPEIAKQAAVLFAFTTGALTIGVLALFKTHFPGYQLTDQVTWISDPHISWSLGVDGISLWLVVLTGILFPLAMFGAPPHHDEKPFYAWLLLLEAGCLGAFLARDLFLFFIFFEIVLVPMYFLISGWGYEERKYAANKFFLYTMFGSAFMLVGVIATAVLSVSSVFGNPARSALISVSSWRSKGSRRNASKNDANAGEPSGASSSGASSSARMPNQDRSGEDASAAEIRAARKAIAA